MSKLDARKRILIIEDEKNLARFLDLELSHEGYETSVEGNGRSGLELALSQEWDVILLDLMLPDLNGFEVCRRIRKEKTTPIIMVTAKDSVLDRVAGLDDGADDYLVKPFAIEELLARLRALIRRSELGGQAKQAEQKQLVFRDLIIEPQTRTVIRGNEIIQLSKREASLLLILVENANTVVSRDELLRNVWGYNEQVATNVVDVYIRYLRNKIDRPNRRSYIQTVRGTGYVMHS
ncbi:MAG TPA: response regulator transcription factor [Lapidilactobacillus dextrinicus]|uniref:Response regulator transcription factor n=1 Tax=Lapidilactobacillus dextrinicus TaxID=51664 RepID=A0A921DUX3_9LACO|nr:response regulator transcription factor [Lapidilactobacillus dextrinicus]HJE15586.1 response regulator transcription factor [Lapidilactobacillus dextrinicus]